MTFLVIARDGTDEEAPKRREAVREAHLERIRPLVDDGTVQLGGAILDDRGAMVGSALLIEADSSAEVRALLARDIYSTAGVWQEVEVYPFKRAV